MEKPFPDGWLRIKIPRAAPTVTWNHSSVPERNPPAALNPTHIPERTRKSVSGRDEIKISAKIWFLLLEIAFLKVHTHFYLRGLIQSDLPGKYRWFINVLMSMFSPCSPTLGAILLMPWIILTVTLVVLKPRNIKTMLFFRVDVFFSLVCYLRQIRLVAWLTCKFIFQSFCIYELTFSTIIHVS